MPESLQDMCPEIKAAALKAGVRVDIVGPGDPAYPADRVIWNLRFDYRPSVIGYCHDQEAVSWCLKWCNRRARKVPFRVRSGGHQHEGMCSGDGVFLIDLSKMNSIEFCEPGEEQAWIAPGTPLQTVYTELEKRNRILPGGACETVCIAGLVQGGGWGMSVRQLGLTCDNLLEAEVVLADGSKVRASPGENPRLLWALRGGGGGNFGIATRFKFKLTTLKGDLTTFALHYFREDMEAITACWLNHLAGFSNQLSSICRLKVIAQGQETKMNASVLLAGQYYGDIASLKRLLQPFYAVAAPVYENFDAKPFPPAPAADQCAPRLGPDVQHTYCAISREPAPVNALAAPATAAGAPQPPAPPSSTCDRPHPHKISSAFPKHLDYDRIAKAVTHFILEQSEPIASVNTYLSLMCMGGKVKEIPSTASAFPWRHKEFMLQYQAWSGTGDHETTIKYLDWITRFRTFMAPHTEGAFINFPDLDLVPDARTPQGRMDLLRFYYGDNLDGGPDGKGPSLMDLKTQYDPDNCFSFGMSIPVRPPS